MSGSREIEDRAAAWLARRDSQQWTETDQHELAEWLRADTAHRVAFLRLEAGWEKAARLKTFGVGATPGAVPPAGEWRASPFFEHRADGKPATEPLVEPRAAVPRRRRWLAVAASLILVIAASAAYLFWPLGSDYATPVGSVTSIALRDGSRVTLNTASRVHVSLNESERHVELEAGEAFFEVAHDATRPFVVTAGTRRIIAVGTRFSVRMEGDEVRVVVTEGKVRFERDENAGAELLVAGQTAHSTRNAILVQEKTAHDAETALSWRSGYLTFDETTLADAVAEFNRYTERKIRIADPKLAAIRINGKFRSSNADEFVELLRSGFGIHAEETADIIRLSE